MRFDPDIPGDDAGTFHSVDLWFFFNNLDKCWRPFVGRHYDLARQMNMYWVNFIKTGNPNGTDVDGTPLTEWKPYGTDRNELVFTSDGPVAKKDPSADSGNCEDRPEETGGKRREKRSIPGSTAFVPTVAGLIMAGEVINDLTEYL